MAVLNKRAIVTAIEMYGVTAIKLPSTLGLNYSVIVQALFANGEQGFFYDPNDLSTMYQDAAGTVAVTAVGQAVGLMLDKSKGLLSTETVVNPDFDSDTAWIKGSNVTISNGSAILNVANGNPVLSQNVGLTAGKWYEVTVDVTEVTSGSSVFRIYGTGGNDAILSIPSAGIYKAMTKARSDATGLIGFSASSTSMKISSVSVKELAGNHAFQTTSASRPILRKNAVTGANYLEFDGSDDFLQTGNIDFTVTDKVSLFTGVQRLGAASIGTIAEFSTNSGSNTNSFYLVVLSSDTLQFNSRGAGNSATVGRGFPITSASVVVSSVGDISGDVSKIRVNGGSYAVNVADQGTGNYGNYPLYIGRRGGTFLPFNGHIYGLIGIGKLVSDNETTTIEKELAKRTGVTL